MRQKYVAGNWKMNLTRAEGQALIEGLRAKMPANPPVQVGVFTPFPILVPMVEAAKGAAIVVGAQNCYFEAKGAFTGEVSVGQIKDTGATAVLIGHSERRHIFKEDNALLKKKVVAALAGGLEVVYCVGELLEERDGGRMEAVLDAQLTEVLGGEISLDHIVVAYEPVWAIGTGRTATPAQAQEAHAFIRQRVAKLYNSSIADTLRIQYGGSVKADNARELMSQGDVDGVLVGGASLKADEFVGIINGAIAAK